MDMMRVRFVAGEIATLAAEIATLELINSSDFLAVSAMEIKRASMSKYAIELQEIMGGLNVDN